MRPSDLPLPFLEDITDQFSDNRKLGSGGYGEVYMGVLDDGSAIAVKKLYHVAELNDEQFKNESSNLMRVRHQNIVRLLGYCDEIRHIIVKGRNGNILCQKIYRVLCFEYQQRGSLEKHLYGTMAVEVGIGFDWPTRYKIIKGICEGLNYLHGGLEVPIFHLDLKPANILLGNNLVPKIADFGLSRLFSGKHTRTTEVCAGTEYYMPPEYILKRHISNKYDVFSLGIIIIQMMTGRMGFSNYGDMSSPQQFIELVHKNWKERIGATSKYAEQDCQQVKRCIEIALSCVEGDRDKRPTIRDIVRELKKTENKSTASFWDQAKAAKIGQWGGVGGRHLDIEVAPHRLESLTIRSDEVIYSLEFSYSDQSGQQHKAGPWGAVGPNKGSHSHTIQLGLSEYLLEVSGTIGPFYMAPAGVVTSLTFLTNARSYGPFGEVKGTPFQVPVQSNGSIVGFFARAGWYLDAFGVYVNSKQATDEKEAGLAKIGLWGGNGGSSWDIKVAPHRLESFTIRSDIVVDSLEFSYQGEDGQNHTVGPWGGAGGSSCTIQFEPSEFLTGVYGTTASFTNSPTDVITSLTLVTNARSYGPFGQAGGIPFQAPMLGNSSIVGFFGRADTYVNAIGFYVNPEQKVMEQEAGLTKIGPWGGTGGTEHDMGNRPEPYLLESVKIHCDSVIDSIEFSYSDHSGMQHTVGPWGGPGGKVYEIRLKPLEYVQGISGTFGPFGTSSTNVITSLTLATSQGRGYGPFGIGGGTPFNLPVESNYGCIVGFFGRVGSYLEAIGAYVQTY